MLEAVIISVISFAALASIVAEHKLGALREERRHGR
jgi:hypothetical protein